MKINSNWQNYSGNSKFVHGELSTIPLIAQSWDTMTTFNYCIHCTSVHHKSRPVWRGGGGAIIPPLLKWTFLLLSEGGGVQSYPPLLKCNHTPPYWSELFCSCLKGGGGVQSYPPYWSELFCLLAFWLNPSHPLALWKWRPPLFFILFYSLFGGGGGGWRAYQQQPCLEVRTLFFFFAFHTKPPSNFLTGLICL